jgi:DNA-binding transcriptional LysR family regulator
VSVSGVVESDDMEVVQAAVVGGLGIGVLPVYMAGDALQQRKLVPLLRHFRPVPESGIYLVYFPNRSLPSRVRALIDFLVARFGPVPPWEMGW